MSTQTFTGNDQREYVLAEFRCALVRAKLAQYDIEAVALALKFRLVSAEQAVAAFWDSDAVQFLGVRLGSDDDPPPAPIDPGREVRE